MGHEGMRASLVSREIIADSVETVMHAERFDAFVGLAGCDKSLARDADGRRPARPARWSSSTAARSCRVTYGDRALDIVSVFEAVGARAAGTIDDAELDGDRAQRVPDRGFVRRDVHRQHHGVGGRGARHVAAGGRLGAGGRPPPGRSRLRSRPGRDRAPRTWHPAPPDHDQAGVRERDRRRDGARRLDERRAAPARDRERGACRARCSTTSTGSAGECRTSPT